MIPSTSGNSLRISSPYRCVRHPVTMSARQAPSFLSLASSRIVLIDSSRARSMNAHVLTIKHSASSAVSTSGNPACVSIPSISSESTWFLGQPRVVRWIFIIADRLLYAHAQTRSVREGRGRAGRRRARPLDGALGGGPVPTTVGIPITESAPADPPLTLEATLYRPAGDGHPVLLFNHGDGHRLVDRSTSG